MQEKKRKKIMIILDKIANFQIRLIFAVFYFIVVFPTGLIMRIFKDPLQLRARKNSYWITKESLGSAKAGYERRQF